MAKKPSGGGGATYDDYFGEIPPESTSFGFPLYITVPFEGYIDSSRCYERTADNISLQLFEWANENKVVVDEVSGMVSYEAYPDNLYLNGRKVKYMITDVNILMGSVDITCWDMIIGEGDMAYLEENGIITIISYKK